MNWLTTAFNKLFSNEQQDKQDDLDKNELPTYKQSKTPFRFPLISDKEKDQLVDDELEDTQKEEEFMPLYMHKQWQQQRENAIVHHATKPNMDKSSKKIVEPKPKPKVKESYQEVKPRITKVPVQSKKFIPSDVPSPIHGFTRTKISPINELLAKKNSDEVVATVESTIISPSESAIFKPSEPTIQTSSEPITIKPSEPDIQTLNESITIKPSEPDIQTLNESITIKPSEPDIQTLNERITIKPGEPDIQTLNEPITNKASKPDIQTSNEPITIKPSELVTMKEQNIAEHLVIQDFHEKVDVEPNSTIENVKSVSSVQIAEIQETEIKKKSLPFNVLMLNSDKEKYNKKKVQTTTPSAITQVPIIESNEEMSTVIQNVQADPVLDDLQSGYVFPENSYLVPPEEKTQDYEWMQMQADRLIESLSYFQVKADIVNMVQGPAVTQFEMTVGQGTKVSKIRNLADDLKLALAAKDIRIQAPIPGKSSIGIEIPNQTSRPVRLSEVVGSSNFKDSDSPLEAALGLDLTGKPVTIDLRKMPHGLIAGATGSGKSVCINSILISLLYKATPKELNLLLIDPKMVELAPFNHIPHLVSPVITDVKAATAALKWAVEEMERRYQLFAHTGVRDISRYNAMAEEKRQFAQKLPYLLIVIDELADLMMMAPTEVEESICRIAQKARACGIHLIVATQRPSVDVITGLIKANIPTRIAFSVSSQIDSRTILDGQGAERLLGRGDMLYLGNGMSAPIRLQGTYVTDEEMEEIIDHARSQGEPSYLFEQEELVRRLEVAEDQDELFEEACRFILEQGSASTSLLQRKFHMGYNRAARLVDLMEQHGYVSESRGSKAREVFITENDIQQLFN
ncbi:DNA translocase FtsK [Paenisporosarcina sp. TG-14]|uniref:DNA translocase FtsK n=1 Tax=Paenisporosarcina sp. TG-14 TaxID=1231057 RepID=UPI00037B567D|nr:DNA translocase FtsK [Paenisporosarcina sp. TG-14]